MATENPTPTPAPEPAKPPAPSPGVKRVQTLQRILGVTVTGKMGKPTRDALAAYQSAASLPATGELDAETWKALHR